MELVRRKYGLDLTDSVKPALTWLLAIIGLGILLLGAGRRSGTAVGAGAAVIGSTLIYRSTTRHQSQVPMLPRRNL